MKCKFPAPILPPSSAPHSPPERAETRAGVHARGTRAHRRLPREHHHARLCAAPRLPRHQSASAPHVEAPHFSRRLRGVPVWCPVMTED